MLPDGYVFSPQYATDYINDSNANETGCTGAITTPNTPGGVNLTIDAGMWQPASIGDFVWNDSSNCNGIRDGGESGVANVTVHLYRGGGVWVNTTKTANGGYYLFTNLLPGEYYLVFLHPVNYKWTVKDAGDDGFDSDVDSLGFTDIINLSYGETNLTLDAGLCRCYASIGDFVWYDCSGGYYDGIQSGESGFNVSVTVHLFSNSTGDWINVINTTTNTEGYYTFEYLDAGEYYLEFELPPEYEWTLEDQGSDSTVDSDVNASTNRTGIFTLGSCETALNFDAGLWKSGECAPIPELDTVVLFSAGLLTLTGYVVVRRRKIRR